MCGQSVVSWVQLQPAGASNACCLKVRKGPDIGCRHKLMTFSHGRRVSVRGNLLLEASRKLGSGAETSAL